MNITLKSCFLLAAASFSVPAVHAQTAPAPAPEKSVSQNIIIRKKDSTKEKITVVIDGNNVTVNGKPVDDFVSNDVDIINQQIDNDQHVFVYGGGDMPPMAPMPPAGPPMRSFSMDMKQSIKTNNAFLGVMTEKTDQGAKVTEVTAGSAAEKAGLKENDVITKVGSDEISGPEDLYKIVGKHKPEEKIAIAYVRGGKPATTNATLGKSEDVKVYSWNVPGDFNEDFNKGDARSYNRNYSFSWDDKPRLGISAQDLEDGTGVKIVDIDDEDSPAAKAGLKEDDIITQVNGKAIASTDDLRQNIKDLKKGDTVKITYKRSNQTKTVDVKIPKELKTINL